MTEAIACATLTGGSRSILISFRYGDDYFRRDATAGASRIVNILKTMNFRRIVDDASSRRRIYAADSRRR